MSEDWKQLEAAGSTIEINSYNALYIWSPNIYLPSFNHAAIQTAEILFLSDLIFAWHA